MKALPCSAPMSDELDDLRAEMDVLDTFEASAAAVHDSPTVNRCQQRRRALARRIKQVLQPDLFALV